MTQIGDAKLLVGPDCPSCDRGILDVYFRNDSARPVPLFITIDQNLEDASDKPTDAHISHILINLKTNEQYNEKIVNSLESGAMMLVRLEVTNVREEGEWKAKIYNQGNEITTFHVYRIHSPFNVTLDVAKPDKPEMTFEKRTYVGEGGLRIPLKNEDGYSYLVKLEFVVKGISSDPCEVMLPPKSSTVAKIGFSGKKPGLFNHSVLGRFKDETSDGQLILTQLPARASGLRACPGAGTADPNVTSPSGDSPSKIIPVTVHLKYCSQPEQYFWIGLVLLFGALCSLILNAYLPNQAQRSNLKKKLEGLRARIRGLPMELASRVRVSLGLEVKRCHDLLGKNLVINPRFSEVIAGMSPRVDRLTRRVALAEQLGSLRMRFDSLRETKLFPTPMAIVWTKFEKADNLVRQLEFSQDHQTQAEAIVKDLDARIDNLEDTDKFYANQHDQVDQIAARARLLLQDGPEAPPGAGHPWPHEEAPHIGRQLYKRMYYSLFDLWRLSRPAVQGKLPPFPLESPHEAKPEELKEIGSAKDLFPEDGLRDADRLTKKMDMLRECAGLRQGADHFVDLAELLESQNPEKFEAACRLLEQVKENVYSDEAESQIRKGAATQRIREWKDWGGSLIGRKLFSVSAFLATVVAILAGIMLFIGNHFCWLAGLLFVLLAIAVLRVGLGDPLTWSSNCLDSRAEKNDLHKLSRACRRIWKADRRNVRIELGTNEVHVFEPVQLRVKFTKEALNFEGVLGDLTPLWNFDHDNLAPEEGWEVVHYFPRERKYNVLVKFQKREGDCITYPGPAVEVQGQDLVVASEETVIVEKSPAGTVVEENLRVDVVREAATPIVPQDPSKLDFIYVFKEIEARPMKHGAGAWDLVMDVMWVIVALIPALAALFTGAIDQLNKLDFMPAMVAIFGLGFASDQVKNLIKKAQ